jgi:dolichyl-diphosphooligosaccharide--protein glycosyltransferase
MPLPSALGAVALGAQIGPLGVFCGYQVLELFDWVTGRRWKARLILLASLAAAGAATVHWLLMHGVADGVVWDAHVRIKSLFIPHTKTGNPLTDSVAEHQSTPSSVYVQYLHHTLYLAPIGVVFLLLSILFGLFQKRGPVRPEGKLFVIAYLICSGYFASKMIRLVLLAAPAASIAAGASLGLPLDLGLAMVFESAWVGRTKFAMKRLVGLLILALLFSAHMVKYPMHKKPLATFKIPAPVDVEIEIPYPKLYQKKKGSKEWTLNMPKLLKKGRGDDFFDHCVQLAEALSEPQIMTRGRHQDGSTVIIDDWREGYWWLKNNTPPDARIMAWWDYGYQITGAYLYIGTYMCACTHPARAHTHRYQVTGPSLRSPALACR